MQWLPTIFAEKDHELFLLARHSVPVFVAFDASPPGSERRMSHVSFYLYVRC